MSVHSATAVEKTLWNGYRGRNGQLKGCVGLMMILAGGVPPADNIRRGWQNVLSRGCAVLLVMLSNKEEFMSKEIKEELYQLPIRVR